MNTKKNLSLVYIAAPYSHKNKLIMQLRYEITNKICGKIISEYGCSIFSPISHGHMIDTDNDMRPDFDKVDYWMEVEYHDKTTHY